MFIPATENDYNYSESWVFSGVRTPNDRMTTANLGFMARFVIAASDRQPLFVFSSGSLLFDNPILALNQC